MNPYRVLGIKEGGGRKEVRNAFRKLAVRYHPDKNPDRRKWSEEKFRQVYAAYETLLARLEREERRGGEERLTVYGDKPEEPYFLKCNDPKSRCLSILHFLLNEEKEKALQLFQGMLKEHGIEFLCTFLSRRDFLDTQYLVAEALEEKGNLHLAARLYRDIVDMESSRTFPWHYLSVVVEKLKDLYLRKLPRSSSPEQALMWYQESEALGLNNREKGKVAQGRAEAFLSLGKVRKAVKHFRQAERYGNNSRSLDRLRVSLSGHL